MKHALFAALIAAAPLCAQEALPDFATCLDSDMAQFERSLRALQTLPEPREFEIGDTRGVGWCGSAGIIACDRSETPYPCQHRLAALQEATRRAVLDSLPPPESLPDAPGDWAAPLYPRVYALAHGLSAGPDCDGATEARGAWCAAWEANNRLRDAVLAHQLARYFGVTAPAVDLGWAQVPPPVRPVARNAEGGE
ncbi:hypothetical protein [Thetidibacter halocola]|uniref:Uncharacterized protein n=1 Tax=Thetidibacter halocola TaxID=2827239 RepID=A0A8J7WFU3_9RHOB|nr:hypothetical protein [Thetidibacter halocola]MBS0124273.1 hypothetical protein [Thetidibacter halocola]